MYAMLASDGDAADLVITFLNPDTGNRVVRGALSTTGKTGRQINGSSLCTTEKFSFPNGVREFTLTIGADSGGAVDVSEFAFALMTNEITLGGDAIGRSRGLPLARCASDIITFTLTEVEGGFLYRLSVAIQVVSGGSNSGTVTISASCTSTEDDGEAFSFTGTSATIRLIWLGPGDGEFNLRLRTRTTLMSDATLMILNKSQEEDPTDSSSPCFPASATVQLASRDSVSMHLIKVGDAVATGLAAVPESSIFLFSHRNAKKMYPFVRLHTEDGGAIALSGSHYIFSDGTLTAAKAVIPGSLLTRADGTAVKVVAKEDRVWLRGLYNPHTATDTLVVDGFKVSCLTTAIPPMLARVLLFPLRMLNVALPDAFFGRVRWMERMIPNGLASYE